MGGELFVGAVDVRLVTAGARDGALELIGDPQGGRATEVLDHPGVGADPVGQLLGRGRLGVGEAAGAEHGDEQLHAPPLTRATVDQRRPLAGKVDEGLLAGAMHLPHRRPQPLRPLPVEREEPGAAVAVRVNLGVLFPEQLQRDAVALEFAVNVRVVRPDAVAQRGGAGVQPGLERSVVQLGRQRPAQALLGRPLQIQADRAHADGAGLGYRPVRQPAFVLEPENLTYLPHR